MHRLLRGYRVLDLTNVLAGPFCGHQLAHLGAEVIKVEIPGGGDLARQLGADASLNERRMGVSFLAQNAGKRSIAIDLKHPDGKRVLRRLAARSDALVENFRPGVMDRLELGHKRLLDENPHLVYCAISGFGQDGPLRGQPAYDQIIQGMSGLMSITGDADGGPLRVGYPVADTVGGLTAALGVAAALAARGQDPEAPGCFIDVSMLEAVIATMGWVVSNHLVAGREPGRFGNENVSASPSGTFETGDGLLNIAANKQEQFEALCGVLDVAALVDEPRFAGREARLAHRFELKALLEEALGTRPAAEWAARLNAAGVPAGPVLTVQAILDHPQVRDRGLVGEFDAVPGVGRAVRVVRTGIKVDGTAPRVDTPPPRLGADTAAILTDAGYGTEAIAALIDAGVVASDAPCG